MANPEHVAKLREGIEAWNEWRKINPKIRPDLSRLNFAEALADTDLVNAPWNNGFRVDLGAPPGWYSSNSNSVSGFSELYLNSTRSGDFARRPPIDFSSTDLWRADLSGARLEQVDFSKANLWGANLSHVQFWGSIFRKTNLRSCDVSGSDLSRVVYFRSELQGLCHGIKGVESTTGHATLRRDLLDQDVIDNIAHQYKGRWFNPARYFLFWPWVWLDYGRSWLRVALLAVFLILIFGIGYALTNDLHIQFTRTGATVSQPFYPWFVASMGFATLGISDLVEPLDGWGQALMIGNVLSGFVTLGLLLSVLGNSFARRS